MYSTAVRAGLSPRRRMSVAVSGPSASLPRSMVCRSYGVPSRSVSTRGGYRRVPDQLNGDQPVHRQFGCPQAHGPAWPPVVARARLLPWVDPMTAYGYGREDVRYECDDRGHRAQHARMAAYQYGSGS